MMRDTRKLPIYFNEAIHYYEGYIQRLEESIQKAKDLKSIKMDYHAIYRSCVSLLIIKYSLGDDLKTLQPIIACASRSLIFLFETSRRMGEESIRIQQNLTYDDYFRILVLFSFATIVNGEFSECGEIMKATGLHGRDRLIDLLYEKISGNPTISESLMYPRQFRKIARFIEEGAIDLNIIKQYILKWYDNSVKASWYDSHLGDQQNYEGYWCFEAALVMRLWHLDDSALLSNEYYPTALAAYRKEK